MKQSSNSVTKQVVRLKMDVLIYTSNHLLKCVAC